MKAGVAVDANVQAGGFSYFVLSALSAIVVRVMRGELQATLTLTGGALLLFGVACGSDPGPAQAQAHYRAYKPSQVDIPLAEREKSCRVGAGGIGASTPLFEGGRIGVPELPPVAGTPKDPGGPVQDGQLGQNGNGTYKLSCSVAGSGDGRYRINARLAGPVNDAPSSPAASGSTTIDVLGATIGPDGKGSGRIDFYTSETLKVTPVTGTTCVIEVVPDPLTGELSIAPGSAWITFRCEGTRTGDQQTYCWSDGAIVLNNCATE